MEEDQTDLTGAATDLLSQFDLFLTVLMRPWNGYQIGIAIALFGLAWFLNRIFAPRMRTWLSNRENWPLWRIKTVLAILQRLRGIFFVILIWGTVAVMREVTWPSRSNFLAIIATLALAWLVVAFVTRLIRNKVLRQIVRYSAWAYVTLQITGLLEQTTALLDGLALSLGDFRISALLIVQALLSLGILITAARLITRVTSERIQRSEDMSPSMRVLVVKMLQIVLYGCAIFIGLETVGVDLTGLAFLSGAIGVGLGFGLQKVVSNLVSGVIILLDKSIKPGDVISVTDQAGNEAVGQIRKIGIRAISV
ncbi:MAG: mechanosensitive ion channel domain-containing protein, partial [Pseudomonadota bacterium]